MEILDKIRLAKCKAEELVDSVDWIEKNLPSLCAHTGAEPDEQTTEYLAQAIDHCGRLKREIIDALSGTTISPRWNRPSELVDQLAESIGVIQSRQEQTLRDLRKLGILLAEGRVQHKLRRVRDELNEMRESASNELLEAAPDWPPLPGPPGQSDWLSWFWRNEEDADAILDEVEKTYPYFSAFLQAISPELWQTPHQAQTAHRPPPEQAPAPQVGQASPTAQREKLSEKAQLDYARAFADPLAAPAVEPRGQSWKQASDDPELDSAWASLCATDWVGLGPKHEPRAIQLKQQKPQNEEKKEKKENQEKDQEKKSRDTQATSREQETVRFPESFVPTLHHPVEGNGPAHGASSSGSDSAWSAFTSTAALPAENGSGWDYGPSFSSQPAGATAPSGNPGWVPRERKSTEPPGGTQKAQSQTPPSETNGQPRAFAPPASTATGSQPVSLGDPLARGAAVDPAESGRACDSGRVAEGVNQGMPSSAQPTGRSHRTGDHPGSWQKAPAADQNPLDRMGGWKPAPSSDQSPSPQSKPLGPQPHRQQGPGSVLEIEPVAAGPRNGAGNSASNATVVPDTVAQPCNRITGDRQVSPEVPPKTRLPVDLGVRDEKGKNPTGSGPAATVAPSGDPWVRPRQDGSTPKPNAPLLAREGDATNAPLERPRSAKPLTEINVPKNSPQPSGPSGPSNPAGQANGPSQPGQVRSLSAQAGGVLDTKSQATAAKPVDAAVSDRGKKTPGLPEGAVRPKPLPDTDVLPSHRAGAKTVPWSVPAPLKPEDGPGGRLRDATTKVELWDTPPLGKKIDSPGAQPVQKPKEEARKADGWGQVPAAKPVDPTPATGKPAGAKPSADAKPPGNGKHPAGDAQHVPKSPKADEKPVADVARSDPWGKTPAIKSQPAVFPAPKAPNAPPPSAPPLDSKRPAAPVLPTDATPKVPSSPAAFRGAGDFDGWRTPPAVADGNGPRKAAPSWMRPRKPVVVDPNAIVQEDPTPVPRPPGAGISAPAVPVQTPIVSEFGGATGKIGWDKAPSENPVAVPSAPDLKPHIPAKPAWAQNTPAAAVPSTPVDQPQVIAKTGWDRGPQGSPAVDTPIPAEKSPGSAKSGWDRGPSESPVVGPASPADKPHVPAKPQWGHGDQPAVSVAAPFAGESRPGHPNAGMAGPGAEAFVSPAAPRPLGERPAMSEMEALLRGAGSLEEMSAERAPLPGTLPAAANGQPAAASAAVVWEKPPAEKPFATGSSNPLESLAAPGNQYYQGNSSQWGPSQGGGKTPRPPSSHGDPGRLTPPERRVHSNGAGHPYRENGKSLFAEPARGQSRVRDSGTRGGSMHNSILDIAASRRMIRNDPWLRSPLNMDQEAILTDPSNGVVVVFGSRLSGLDKLMDGIREIPNLSGVIAASPMHEAGQFEHWISEVNASLGKLPTGTALAVVDSSVRWSVPWIRYASDLLRLRQDPERFLRVVFVADPSHDWTWTGDEERQQLGAFELTLRQ